MSKIVEEYVKLNELFQRCAYNQFKGELSLEDMKTYHAQLDTFVKVAKEEYSNPDLDLYTAVDTFISDIISQNEKSIITDEGLFYKNYSDRFKAGLAVTKGSDTYDEHLVWLKENYRIKVGKPQPKQLEELSEESIGIYIVDYVKYLSDMKDNEENDVDAVSKQKK